MGRSGQEVGRVDFIERAALAQRARGLKSRWDRVGRELGTLLSDERQLEALGPGARRIFQSGRRALGELKAGVQQAEAGAAPSIRGTLRDVRALLEETERLLGDLEDRLTSGR